MSDVDVIIRVHTQGVQEIGNLSASLRNFSNTLRGVTVPMAKLDTHTKAVYKALGVTSRGVDQHAKSIKGLIQNQKVLATETKNITRDLNGLRNAYALAGRESTALGRAIGVSTKELSGFSRTFRGMRLRAFGSDLNNISLRLTKLGKDAQFVGRSLMINLTLPLATFARIGLQNFLAMEKQSVRLIKVMENLAFTSDMAAQKILGLQNATAADLSGGQVDRANQMVQAYRKMDKALIDLSLRFGVSKDLTTSLAADFAELGLTAEENVQNITQLTLEIEKLGSMDIGPAQDLSQALFFQSKRAFEVTGAMNRLTTARAREKKAIESSITQMYLFNAIENATALTLKDLGDSFAEISAMATSYGLSMTEAAALLAPMKAAGLDIGASANSIKVSLQRLLAPTKQNVDMLQKLAEQFGVASGAQNEFMMSTKTGLIGLQSVVTMFDKVRKSSQGSEGALRLMSDLFEKRQGPRMYLAIEQLADFNNELQKADDNFSNLPSSTVSAELQLVRTADAAAKKFKNFNTTAVPTTIRSFKDIGNVARIATAFAGQVIEFEPGKGTVITAQDIQNAKEMRKAVSETILEAKQSKGIDLISEVKTEAGRALMIQLAGAANASEVANQELARSLQTAGVSVESIRTTFKMFAADIIAYLIPTIQKLAEKVKQMYETWNSPEFAQTRANIIRLITVVGGFLGVLGPVILAIGTFQSVVGKMGLVMTRLIPKLKNADGGFTLLGHSAEFAKKQVNGLYEAFLKTTGIGQTAKAINAKTIPGFPSGTPPKLPEAVTPATKAKLLDQQKRDAMRAAGISRAAQMRAAREYAAGASVPATGAASRSKLAGSKGRTLPREVVEAMRIIQARDIADATPTATGMLRDSRGRMVSPTSGAASLRSAMLAPVERQQNIFERSKYYEKRGITTDRMGTRFIRRGRDITEQQANALVRGGLSGVRARTQIATQGLRSAIAARPGVAAFRGAMAAAPSTGAGLVSGSAAAIKASTTAMVQNMSSVKGAKAAMAALNAQYAIMGGAGPGRIKMISTAMMGFIKNLKVATLAARIFKTTLMFSGIGAIIAIVAAVIFLVVKNLDKIKGSAKVMEPLKKAFTAVKDAVFMVIRPIQDLFAQFGSGADEGEASGNAIVKAFEGIAAAVAFVAGLFKAFVEKVIQPYLYGIVNIVMAVVSMFKGNWGDAFKFLIAGVASIVKGVINLFVGLGTGIVTVLAKAITVVLDLFGKIPLVGGVFRLASKGVNALANTYKSVARSVADFAIKGLDKLVDLGIKKSTNKISSGAKKQEKAATDAGNLAGEAIANAYGDAPIGGANDKIAGKIKEGLADAAQDLYDYVVERFASSIKKFVSESVKALNKQKESALKVFDIQLNTLVKLERAEESLTRKKEYETNRRKLIDDAALRQQNYLRDRALAIYEGRIDDARILDQEERVASRESDAEIGTLDEGRRKELAKENLDALKEAINEAKEVANRFFEESIEKFQDAAEHITRIAPVTQEQYAAQLEELRLKTIEYSDKNNTEFGTMFEKFSTTIAERMPNTVDDFGKALGAFATPLDELVTLAMNKYGLGSEWDNTVLGVTSKMADSVIGITLGMLVDIGGAFETSAPEITERFGDVTGGIAGEIGTFKTEALASFTTLLEEVKLQFLTPFKKALDEAEPTTVFKNAIIDGNQEILNSFKKLVRLNPDLMKQMAESLDPAIAKYLALKAAADAAADAMSNAGGGGGLGDTGGVPFGEDRAEWNRFMRIKEKTDAQMAAALKAMGDSYSRGLAASGNFQPIYENRAATFKNRYNTYISPEQIRANANPLSRKEGGPIPIGAALKSTPFGISGFLNAPEQEGIPAILHGGEFVVNAEAVKRIGLGALAKINDPRIPKFKKGGFVGTADQAERRALNQKSNGTSAPYAGRLMSPEEKKQIAFTNWATSSANNYKKAVESVDIAVAQSKKQTMSKPKDTRSFVTKTLDFLESVGTQGGLLDKGTQDALNFTETALKSVNDTVIRVPMSIYNLKGALVDDVVKGKLNVVKNITKRQDDLYSKNVELKIGDTKVLGTNYTGKGAVINDSLNIIPIGAGGVLGKIGSKIAGRFATSSIGMATAQSASPALLGIHQAAVKLAATGGLKFAANKAAMQGFNTKLSTSRIISNIEKQATQNLPEFGGKEALYDYLVSKGMGANPAEALDIFKQMTQQAVQSRGSASVRSSIPDLISSIRSEYLSRSSINVGQIADEMSLSGLRGLPSASPSTSNVVREIDRAAIRALKSGSISTPEQPIMDAIKQRLALPAGDTTGRLLPASLFKERLYNPITVTSGSRRVTGTDSLDRDLTSTTGRWVKGWTEGVTAHADTSLKGFLLEGQYFESLPGLLANAPVGFGFNIGSPSIVKRAFPALPSDISLIQAQPFEILDTALGLFHGGGGIGLRDMLNSFEGARLKSSMITDRFSPSQIDEKAYGFVYDYAHAQGAPNSIRMYLKMQEKWLEKLERDLLFYKENPQFGVKTVDDLWKDFVDYNDVFDSLSLDEFNSFIGQIPRFGKNLTPQQIDYIALNAANGNAEAKQMFDQLSSFGKKVRELRVDSIRRAAEKETFDERLNLGNTVFIREELGEFPMFKIQPDGSMTLHSRSSLTHDPNTRRAIDRHTIHGALNHIVYGGTLGGRPNVTGANFITARLEDILKYNPGSLNTLLGYDTNFVAPPFGSIRIPAGKFDIFKEGMETFQTYPGMRDPYMDSIMQSMYRQRYRLESTSSWHQWQIMRGQERVYTREYASKLKKEIEDRMILESFYRSSIIGNPMGVDLNQFLEPVMHGNPAGSKTMDFYNYMMGVEGRDSRGLINDLDEFLYDQQTKYVTDIREGLYGQYLHDYKKVLEYYEKLYPELVDKFNESYSSRPIYEMIDAAHPEMAGSAGNTTIQKTVTRDALRKKVFGPTAEGGYGAPAVKAGMQEVNYESQRAFTRIGLSLPDPVIPVFHPDMYAAISHELPKDSFANDGTHPIAHLTQIGRNQILRNYASDSVWIQDFLGYFPGKFTRLKTIAQKPWEEVLEAQKLPQPSIGQIQGISLAEQLRQASQLQKDATLPIKRKDNKGLFIKDTTPDDVFGITPFVPPAVPSLSIINTFSQQLEVFKALHSLARAKNTTLMPYEQELIQEYTSAFNKALTLRTLDLSGDTIALEAYRAKLEKLYGDSGSVAHPVKPNSTVRIMQRLEAMGRFGGSVLFKDILENPEIQQMIDVLMRDINQVIKKGSVIYPEDIQVYRGLGILSPQEDPDKYMSHLYRPGFILPGQYASTSINEQVARSFASNAGFPIIEHITIPKGLEVFSPSYYGLGLQNEREIIIPPKYRLRIDDVQKPIGTYPYYKVMATAMEAAGSSIPKFMKGGYVKGMTSTAIPAMLHGGEYVLNAKAVQQLGLPYLNAMNQVSQSQFRPPSSRVNAPSGNVTNNVSTVNIQVENFIGEEAWFESMMKEYNVNVLPKNQKLAGLEQRKFTSYNGINQGM